MNDDRKTDNIHQERARAEGILLAEAKSRNFGEMAAGGDYVLHVSLGAGPCMPPAVNPPTSKASRKMPEAPQRAFGKKTPRALKRMGPF